MRDSSDTEPDSDQESCMVAPRTSPPTSEPYPSATDNEAGDDDHRQSVTKAVEDIQRIELSQIAQDTEIHDRILRASRNITRFLEDMHLSEDSEEDISGTLSDFATILHPSFLLTLFEHRKIFHGIAISALPSGTTVSTVVCWVDGLMAKLADTIVLVACGFSLPLSLQYLTENLRLHREDDNLRAASQLPHSWQSVPGVIGSQKASPAARRLALRLVFGVIVIGPNLVPCDAWTASGVRPNDMKKILDQSTIQSLVDEFTSTPLSDHLSDQERLNFAMVLSLLATTELALQEDVVEPKPIIMPKTLGSLLQLIGLVLHPKTTAFSLSITIPYTHLDGAQTILLHWGETVRWCWETWDDPRIANSETVVFLTVNWLHHLNMSAVEPSLEKGPVSFVTKNPPAASNAIMQVLHHLVLSLVPAPPSGPVDQAPAPDRVLFETCHITVQILRSNFAEPHGLIACRVPDICKHLCSLFVHISITSDSDTAMTIRELMIEALTMISSEILQSSLKQLQGDPKNQFTTKLDAAILRARRTLAEDPDEPTILLAEPKLLTVKLTLQFLTIIWHSKIRGCVLQSWTSPLLCSLVDLLLRDSSYSLGSTMLLNSVVTAISRTERDQALLARQESVWHLSLSSPLSDLFVASAFCHYILATEGVLDPLSCAEAWNHLRDILLLVIRHHFIGSDEPLALLICPLICRTLIRLIQDNVSPADHFILSSPWTMTLCSELKTLFGSDDTPTSDYSKLLKGRLESTGKALLNQISCKLQSASNLSVDVPEFQSRLIYISGQLILIPDIA